MKKISLLLYFFLLAASPLFSQTQAEIDAMMKKALAEIEKMKKDPKVQSELYKINSGNAATKLPARNDKLLNALPKQKLSRQQLVSFITQLHADLLKKLPAQNVKSVQDIILKLNKNASKIGQLGAAAWYKNAPYESVLLMTYAASQSPDDITLNNCAAILNLCGLEEKAIPLLKYALGNEPTNGTLLNNLGQAYAGLGAIDTAKYYLMGCIRSNSTHPEACGTVAYIEYEQGNMEKAQQYAEQALKGAYSSNMARLFRKLKKNGSLFPMLANNLSNKHFFIPNGFSIPPNCRNWEESGEIYAQQQTFLKKMDGLQKGFEQVIKQNSPTDMTSALAMSTRKGPLAGAAQELKDAIGDIYIDEKNIAYQEYIMEEVKSVTHKANDEMDLVNKYIPRFKAAEKNPEMYARLIVLKCNDKVALDNKWFDIRATRIEKFKDAWLEKDIKLYDNLVFLTSMTTENENIYNAETALYAFDLITKFKSFVLNNCNPASKPDCTVTTPGKSKDTDAPIFNQAKCPINLEVPFGVGKMSLNCARFEFEIGEGIILTYEKNFISRESTVALGLGVSAHIPYTDVAGYTPIEFGVKEQFYIKFDKNNQPTDLGLLWEAEMDFKGLAAPEFKVGFTMGINSSYNFQPGFLQGVLN